MEKLEHIRYFLLFEFNRGGKQRRRPETFAPCMRTSAIRGNTSGKWFSRLNEDYFDINDISRSGRTSGFDEDRLNTLIHIDPRQCTRELANMMKCVHSTIVRH